MNTVATADGDLEDSVTQVVRDAHEAAQTHVNPLVMRDKLFHQYMPLANKIACRKQKDMPRCVQLDELKSAAYVGLLDAATKYDEKRHEQFPVYARIRILGEINDYLRRCTWGGRNRQFYGWSLDVPVYGCRTRRPVPLEEGLTVEQEMSSIEADELFTDLTKSLPQKVRNIFRYYYLDNLTMKEISLIEGLCESRVSQLMSHYKAVLKKIWSGRECDLWNSIQPTHNQEKFRLNNTIGVTIEDRAKKKDGVKK